MLSGASPSASAVVGPVSGPGGGMLAEIRFGSTDWLPMFVAQHGGMVRILQPGALANASREWIAAALTQYEASSDRPID